MTNNINTTSGLRWGILVIAITCLSTGLLEVLHRHLIQTEDFTLFGSSTWVGQKWFVFLLTGGGDGLFKRLGFDLEMAGSVVNLTLFLGFVLIAQWLFLLPGRNWRVSLAETARPMKTAVLVAAFMATLLTVGMGASLLDLTRSNWLDKIGNLAGFYIIMVVLWLVWTVVFYLYWRRRERWYRLTWMINSLIAGSILESFVAIGVYAWNPQNDSCWCARGAYTGLVFGATVMIWLFGPGVILLFLYRQRRRTELLKSR